MTLSNTTGFDLPETASAATRVQSKTLLRAANDDVGSGPEKLEVAEANAGIDLDMESDTGVVDIPTEASENNEAPIAADNVPLPPIRKPVVARSRTEICDTLARAAHTNDLPVPFFIRLLFQESGFRPDVVSSAGAQGIAQFMPETAADEGLVNPFDPLQAIPASARLLRKLFEQFGNLGLAAAAYNAGPKRIDDWLHKKSDLPEETQGYVKIITGKPADNWRLAEAKFTAHTLPQRAPCKDKVTPLPPPAPHPHLLVAESKTKEKASADAEDTKTKKPAAKKAAAHHKTTEQLAAREHGKKRRTARD
jgi:hypothetical protein